MKLLLVFVSGALLAAVPRGAHAQVSVDLSFGAPPGEAIDSTDVFYDQLAPYGMWVDDPQAGRVFMPEDANFVPYTNGHWEYTDVGYVWVSPEPFSSVTSHYGRWFYSDEFGRWEWVPGTEWAPAWVQWSEAGDDYGWSPMPPDFASDYGYSVPVYAWHFAPAHHLFDRDVDRYYVPRDRVTTIVREARPIQRYASVGNARVAAGPAPATLRAKGIEVRAQKVEPKTIGRMQPAELRAAQTRARARLPQIEEQNRQRVEANPKLRQAARPAADLTKPAPQAERRPGNEPARPEAKPAMPARPEARPETRPEAPRAEPTRPEMPRAEPQRPEPRANEAKPMPEPNRAEPQRAAPQRPEPQRPGAEPMKPANRAEPRATPPRVEPARPEPRANEAKPIPEPQRAQPAPRAEPQRAEPKAAEPKAMPEPKRAEPQSRNEPKAAPRTQAKAEPSTQAKAEPKAERKPDQKKHE